MPKVTIRQVLSNNAIVADTGDVLVGKGIGFGRKSGDLVTSPEGTRHYVQLDPEQVRFLHSLRRIEPTLVEAVSTAVDHAGDTLGPLHPSVYVLLMEHISFAVNRVRAGDEILSGIAGEIHAIFPAEYAAAETMLQLINTHIQDVQLPPEEASYVALHLSAARSGVSVKAPLAAANELALLVSYVTSRLAISNPQQVGLTATLARLIHRMRAGTFRTMVLHTHIAAALPAETDIARHVVCRILGTGQSPHYAEGEIAYLAVFLSGCVQDDQANSNETNN